MNGARKLDYKVLLAAHDKFSLAPDTLAQAAGDSYLYRHSPIFRNVRDAFLKLGYRFDEVPPYPYWSMELLALPEILESKTVPVIDNVHWLRKCAKAAPTISFSMVERLGIKANFLLHESAHCVAYSIVGAMKRKDFSQAKTRRIELVKICMAESFANAVEYLSAHLMDNSPVSTWFIGKNMYISVPLHKESRSAVRRLERKVGLQRLMKLSMLLYLYSSFLYSRIGPAEEKKILDVAGINLQERRGAQFKKHFKRIVKDAFNLDAGFRVVTTELYLKFVGFNDGLSGLLSFDPLDTIASSDSLIRSLDRLAKIASEGAEPASHVPSTGPQAA